MIIIPARHNGPPGSGHGGVTAGRLAELVDSRRATVRFHSPIPLETPLVPTTEPGGVVKLRAGADLVATARPLDHPIEVAFDALPADLVAWAELGWPDGTHTSPTCFGCGPLRRPGDGLRLRPGLVAGYGVHATSWTPPGTGEVPPWLVWAALDCAGAGPCLHAMTGRRREAVDEEGTVDEQAVTGELAVEIRQPVLGGASYMVMSRMARQDGRKLFIESAVLDATGSVRAASVATWLKVPASADGAADGAARGAAA